MNDPSIFEIHNADDESDTAIDPRFVSRFSCILTLPKDLSRQAIPYAYYVVREWQSCVAWLESAKCNNDQTEMIRMLAAASDKMWDRVGDLASARKITQKNARIAVHGDTDRVPIFAMLLHLAIDECGPRVTPRLRPLAAQILLAYATLIYHDEGARIDLCQGEKETKPPVPSAVAACRLVRQMASGRHADLVARLPVDVAVFADDYEKLRAGAEQSNPRYQKGLDAICVTLGDARSRAKRRSKAEGRKTRSSDPDRTHKLPHPTHKSTIVGGTEALQVSPLSSSAARDYERQGLSAAEVRAERETLRSTHTKGERPGASLSMRIRCQQGMLRDRARGNQRLPIRREMIRRGELDHLVSALRPWMRAAQAPEALDPAVKAEAVAMLAMILATGASPDEVHALPIVRDENSVPKGQSRAILYDVGSFFLWVRVPKPDLNPHAYALVPDLLRPTSEGLWLPLPAEISSLLTFTRQSAGTTGTRTLLVSDLHDLEEAATQVLHSINRRHHCQLQLTRLPGVLPQVIADRAGNWSYAWILCGEGDPNVHTPLVYQTTPASTLVAAYRRDVAAIFGFSRVATEDASRVTEHAPAVRLYGSALQPIEGVWVELARELREIIPPCPPRRAGITEHVAHHNALVVYTVMLVLVGTGLRAVRDPVESPLDIDWNNALLFVVDKESHARGNERYIPLASQVLEQLRAYRRHLNGLADRMAHRNPKAALLLRAASSGKDPKIPFLLFLNSDLSLQSVRPATLQPRLENVFPAPLNFGRHHIRTYLTRNGCCGEWIEAWMGHEPVGMEAFGPFSALSIADLRRIADEHIEPMLYEHGWVVVEGVLT